MVAKKKAPKLPSALIVVALITAASAAVGFGEAGIVILKEVPAGLPRPALPSVGIEELLSLLPRALTIAVISYMEGISVAKAPAAKERETVDANAELLAVGAANLAAGLFRAFPVAGGFSRTAVNHQAGARTPGASIVTALIVGLAVLLFTPLFLHLPKAVLAAIIIVAVAGLVDLRTPVQTWKTRRADGLVVGVTSAGTLLLGIEAGIALGAALSIALFVWKSPRRTRPSSDGSDARRCTATSTATTPSGTRTSCSCASTHRCSSPTPRTSLTASSPSSPSVPPCRPSSWTPARSPTSTPTAHTPCTSSTDAWPTTTSCST